MRTNSFAKRRNRYRFRPVSSKKGGLFYKAVRYVVLGSLGGLLLFWFYSLVVTVVSVRTEASPNLPSKSDHEDHLEHGHEEETYLELNYSSEDDDFDTATDVFLQMYFESGCQGEYETIDMGNSEKRCESCVDMCSNGYNDKIKSVRVLGNGVVIVSGLCLGNFDYGGDQNFVTTLTEDSDCHERKNKDMFYRLVDKRPRRKRLPNPPLAHARLQAWVQKKLNWWGPERIRNPKDPDYEAPVYAEDRGRYVTFLKDCGGFNNIRMGFEHAILIAWVTGRTLVLPSASPWYLLDFGPMKRDPPNGGRSPGPPGHESEENQKVSSYTLFWDIEELKMGIPVISQDEFITKMSLPEEFLGMKEMSSKYERYLQDTFTPYLYDAGSNMLCWPDCEEYEARGVDKIRVGKRKMHALTDEMKNAQVLHIPTCKTFANEFAGPEGKTRFLSQIASEVGFGDPEKEREFKQFFYDYLHYAPEVFKTAAIIISKLGLYQYSSFHIRRNDLQYASSFLGAEAILNNVRKMLNEREILYIATDETDNEFFDAIEREHKVYRWHDFQFHGRTPGQPKGDFGAVLLGRHINRKHIGLIEQVICAGGRRFFGTPLSTFTSYIYRLRGYIDAPDTNQYHHTVHYTGDPEIDGYAKLEYGAPDHYMNEDPTLWSDVQRRIRGP